MAPVLTEIHRVITILGVAAEVVAFCLVPAVLVRRKEPASTIAWILALVFLPALGAILFFFFGRDRLRTPARRKREHDAEVRAKIERAAEDPRADGDVAEIEAGDELERALFRIARALTHAPPRAGNAVEVYSDGNRAYDAIGEALDGAKHHIHAEYYLIRNDATGAWFGDRLAAAAARGVEVRLLCDGYGCLGLSRAWTHRLKKAGVEIAHFLPLGQVLYQPINLRNHRKIIVVDGGTAFTGGLNIGDEYRGAMKRLGEWRDLQLAIRGPAAVALQRVFFQDWTFATGRDLDPAPYFDQPERAGGARIAVVPSGPDTNNEAIHRVFFAAIALAKNHVRISTPYFVPDEAMVVALGVAALRGVRVELILPGRSNHVVTFHAGRSFYEPLLAAGVELYEYEPGIVHAKAMLVDDSVCLVGSANMDLRSFRLNFEVHTLGHDPATAHALDQQFEQELAKCRRIDGAAWRGRALDLRMLEGASRLVSPLL
jgi:cardiolipin synthase